MADISIIGAGNIGSAIALGLRQSGRFTAEKIVVCRRQSSRLQGLAEQGFAVTADIRAAAERSPIVFLCVQPNQFASIAPELRPALEGGGKILISTMTGISMDEMSRELGLPGLKLIRAMPNTAIAVRESMTCVCSRNLTEAEQVRCRGIFACLGEVIEIDESLMKAATVIAASNIAFVMRMIRAVIQGGIQLGFHSDEAQAMAIQVVKGAASLLKANASHPEIEIDRVTTPKGCTIEGLNEMEHQGLSSAIIKGLVASYDKIARLKDIS